MGLELGTASVMGCDKCRAIAEHATANVAGHGARTQLGARTLPYDNMPQLSAIFPLHSGPDSEFLSEICLPSSYPTTHLPTYPSTLGAGHISLSARVLLTCLKSPKSVQNVGIALAAKRQQQQQHQQQSAKWHHYNLVYTARKSASEEAHKQSYGDGASCYFPNHPDKCF